MIDPVLAALVAAWTTTMIVTTMFVIALALLRVWDSAIYFEALQEVLNLAS